MFFAKNRTKTKPMIQTKQTSTVRRSEVEESVLKFSLAWYRHTTEVYDQGTVNVNTNHSIQRFLQQL